MYALFITESKALAHDNKGFRQILVETLVLLKPKSQRTPEIFL